MPVNYNTAPESEITLLDIYDSNVTSVLPRYNPYQGRQAVDTTSTACRPAPLSPKEHWSTHTNEQGAISRDIY